MLSNACFVSSIEFFSSRRIYVWFFFGVPISLVKYSFWSQILFLSFLNRVSAFPCISLNFFVTPILHSVSVRLQYSVTVYLVYEELSFSFHDIMLPGRSQDGGGIGRGDHFLSYKFIERTIERWTEFTKQLLIASSGHHAPRKATHCLRREVGQNIKDKKGDKRARDGDPSQEGSLNKGSFQSPGNSRAGGSEGSFQISEGNLTGRKN